MKDNRGNMNNYVVGIDIGEKESVVIYMSPSGDTLDHISFEMNDNGYNQFRRKVPSEARIAFEASGLAHVVYNKLKSFGYSGLTVAHLNIRVPQASLIRSTPIQMLRMLFLSPWESLMQIHPTQYLSSGN